MSSVVLVFSMLSLGRILISNLVVANLLMYSLPGMILLYLAMPFFIPKMFLYEIYIYIYIYIYIHIYKNNIKIMNFKRGVGIDHCHKK